MAATLLTLASITATTAHSSPVPVSLLQAQVPGRQQAKGAPADSVIISGTVKNEQGEPIENVEIIFDQYQTLSDKNGGFQFTLPATFNKPAVIQLSFGNLEREVRSYHPLMRSTRYDITLYKPHLSLPIVMGGISPRFHLPDSLSAISFQSASKLNAKNQTFLANLALFLKNDPNVKIFLKSSYKTNRQKAVTLSNLIKNYLESEEGINAERIKTGHPQLQKQMKAEVIIDFTNPDE